MKLKVLFLLLSLAFSTALFAGRQDVNVVNMTKKSIHHIYISAAKVDDWEEDILGNDVLDPGETVKVTFENEHKACVWDFKAVDTDGKEYLLMNVNLCQTATINVK